MIYELVLRNFDCSHEFVFFSAATLAFQLLTCKLCLQFSGVRMRNFAWNRFPIKNLLIDSLLTPIVESTHLDRTRGLTLAINEKKTLRCRCGTCTNSVPCFAPPVHSQLPFFLSRPPLPAASTQPVVSLAGVAALRLHGRRPRGVQRRTRLPVRRMRRKGPSCRDWSDTSTSQRPARPHVLLDPEERQFAR